MKISLTQERIVLILAAILFVVFSVSLRGFLTSQNLLTLLRGVSVLGILGIGMLVVVIGRGIDLSLVANMAISMAWSFNLANNGVSVPIAFLAGLGFVVVMGLISGIFVAYADIPPLFATLAMATFVYGFGRSTLVTQDVIFMPPNFGVATLAGQGIVGGIPASVLIAALIALAVLAVLRFTRLGRYIYAIGDNQNAARIGGVPVRPILVLQYAISGVIAFVAGLVTATAAASMNTRVVHSTMIYDVILVVVLGGVGLSGGKGGVRNVVFGTILIGILLNGMTIMDLQYTTQNVIKSVVLLIAIVVDTIVNPRDEQTSQQGDI